MDLGTTIFLMFAVAVVLAVIGYSLLIATVRKELANAVMLLLLASLLVVTGVVLAAAPTS